MESDATSSDKSVTIEFFDWVHKNYFKGFNGWVPLGWGAYASGYTIEQLFDKFINDQK